MDHESEIMCPLPTRPLERKASLLSPSNEADDQHMVSNNLPFFIHPSDRIVTWLSELPTYVNRTASRSDSFLLCKMSKNQNGWFDSNSRHGKPFPAAYNLSPRSSASQWTRPTGPSVEVTSSSEASTKGKRIQSPTYRSELSAHRIYIDAYGIKMPALVGSFAQNVIRKRRASPGLTDAKITNIQKQLARLDNADEGTTRIGFANLSILPKKADYELDDSGCAIEIGSNLQFDRTALPYTSGARHPPVVTPTPDSHYGYPDESFSDPRARLRDVIVHPRILPYAKPNTATHFPFFSIEFKSRSRLGSRWVAENQNAGTGVHSVNSITTLMSYTNTTEYCPITGSLAFSCVVDSDDAALWVHWREPGDEEAGTVPRFASSEIGFYHFRRPSDIRDFRASTKNIIDYGLGERLTMIKSALAELLPQLPRWDAEDRAAMVRSLSQTDDVSDGESLDDVDADPNTLPRARVKRRMRYSTKPAKILYETIHQGMTTTL